MTSNKLLRFLTMTAAFAILSAPFTAPLALANHTKTHCGCSSKKSCHKKASKPKAVKPVEKKAETPAEKAETPAQ